MFWFNPFVYIFFRGPIMGIGIGSIYAVFLWCIRVLTDPQILVIDGLGQGISVFIFGAFMASIIGGGIGLTIGTIVGCSASIILGYIKLKHGSLSKFPLNLGSRYIQMFTIFVSVGVLFFLSLWGYMTNFDLIRIMMGIIFPTIISTIVAYFNARHYLKHFESQQFLQ